MNISKKYIISVNIMLILFGFILICVGSGINKYNLIFIGSGLMLVGIINGTIIHYLSKYDSDINGNRNLSNIIIENNLNDELLDDDIIDNNSLKSEININNEINNNIEVTHV